jgi:hypothetical protein
MDLYRITRSITIQKIRSNLHPRVTPTDRTTTSIAPPVSMSLSPQDRYICPGCGESVRVGTSGCRRCAREQDDDEFDYDAFVREEFGNPLKPKFIAWIWWITAVLLLAVFAWSLFGTH